MARPYKSLSRESKRFKKIENNKIKKEKKNILASHHH